MQYKMDFSEPTSTGWDFLLEKEKNVVKKGDKFLCIQNVYMSGDLSSPPIYVSGRIYVSEKDDCITDEAGLIEHYWYGNSSYNIYIYAYFKRLELPTHEGNSQIAQVYFALNDLSQYKNSKYGNSGLEPINVFSKADAETGLLQRLDDKIARIKNSPELRKNDLADVVGYIVLLCVKKGWTNFDEFKD
jgi:hypothetical protein